MDIKVQVINRNIIDYIESLQYEIIVRKDLLNYINQSKKTVLLSLSSKYKNELDEFKFMYNEALNIIVEKYLSIRNEPINILCKCFDTKTGILTLRRIE